MGRRRVGGVGTASLDCERLPLRLYSPLAPIGVLSSPSTPVETQTAREREKGGKKCRRHLCRASKSKAGGWGRRCGGGEGLGGALRGSRSLQLKENPSPPLHSLSLPPLPHQSLMLPTSLPMRPEEKQRLFHHAQLHTSCAALPSRLRRPSTTAPVCPSSVDKLPRPASFFTAAVSSQEPSVTRCPLWCSGQR